MNGKVIATNVMKITKKDCKKKNKTEKEIFQKKEKKGKKREYGRIGYKNISEKDRQKLKEYRKSYRNAKKSRKSQNNFFLVSTIKNE